MPMHGRGRAYGFYKINPQTVLFLGYTDNYEGYENTGLPQVDRKLFLKIGYALVM